MMIDRSFGKNHARYISRIAFQILKFRKYECFSHSNSRCWQRICPRWETWVSGDSISLLSHDLELADMKRDPCSLGDIQYTSDALDAFRTFFKTVPFLCTLDWI